MGRRKVTYEIDEDLARSLKMLAAREDKPEYAVVEDALRAHLPSERFKALVARVARPVDEATAAELALKEVRAHRRAQARAPRTSKT